MVIKSAHQQAHDALSTLWLLVLEHRRTIMNAKHLGASGDVFVGRKVELDQFDQAIRPSGKLAKLLRGPGVGVRPRVFVLHGIGGMGKTWLAQKCLHHAQTAGWMTAEIDWDTADMRPTDRLGLMNAIAEALKEKYGEGLVRDYLKVRGRVRRIQERVQLYKRENQEKWQSFVELSRSVTEGLVGLIDEKKGKAAGILVNVAGKVVGAGAKYLDKAEDAFVNWLVETGKLKADEALLYREPDQQLARHLVEALSKIPIRRPLVLLLDSCEALPVLLEEWLRDAIVCPAIEKEHPLVFIVSGRYNQYHERQVNLSNGAMYSVKGYADHLTAPPPVAWDLTRFADPEVADYLRRHGLDPKPDLVDFVQSLARGVPFAVQLVTQALLKLGADYVKEHFPPKEPEEFSPQEMVTLVTRRFLRYCLEDEADLERVRGLAVLREWDEGGLRAVWGLPAGTSPRSILRTLEARYSFVLPGGKLHEIVRDFVREDLRISESETARRLGMAAAKFYRPFWEQVTQSAPRLADRVEEPRWRNATLNLLNALCWCDETEAVCFLSARAIESVGFDSGFARALLNLAREFRQPSEWWPVRNHRVANALTQMVDSEGKEETAGLELLLRECDALALQSTHRVLLHFWRSWNSYRAGQFEAALQACLTAESALASDSAPDLCGLLALGFNQLGWSLGWERGSALPSEKARIALEHAVELQKDAAHHHVGLGVMYYGLRKLEEAAAEVEHGIAMGEDKAWARNWLGNVYYALGRHDEAIAAYQRARELDPKDAYPHNNLGNVYYDLNRTDEAIAEYQRAIELDPKYPSPHNGLGNVYCDLKRTDEAIAEYQRASELDPKYPSPHNGLGNVYCDLKRYDEAIAEYQQALEIGGLPDRGAKVYNGLGIVYRDLGRTEEAIAAYQRAIELDPKYAHPHNNLGNVYHALGRTDAAIAEYQRAIELDPKYASPHNGLGNVYHALGRTDEAIAAYQQASELDPKWATPHNSLGLVYAALGHTNEAIAAYQRAIERDPKYAYPHDNLGDVYADLGRHDEAIAAYQRAIELKPKWATPHNDLGHVYRTLNRHGEAIAAYQRASELDPKWAIPHDNLGDVYRDLGRTDEAIAEYQRAIELDPKFAYPHHGLGAVYYDLKRYEEAIAAFQRASELDPKFAYPYSGAADVYYLQGQYSRALELYQKSYELQPRIKPLIGMAGVTRHLGDEAQASKYVEQARALSPDDYNLACLETISGNTEAAIEHLRAALEKQPSQRDWARRDPDFDFIRDDPRFKALLGE
jgi:tetratricopeptide (TPR) repeat protein